MTSWRAWMSPKKCAHGQHTYDTVSVSCILITKFTHPVPCRVIRFKFLQKVRDDGLVATLCGVMQWCHFILKRADIDGQFQPFKLKTSYRSNTTLVLSKLSACILEVWFPPVTQLAWLVVSPQRYTESKYVASVYWCFVSENKA